MKLINFFQFYRLDFCLRNLGIGIIAIFSLDTWPTIMQAIFVIFQLLLVQMYSFSTNNVYDGAAWDENNYTKTLRNNGVGVHEISFYSLLPLLIFIVTTLFSGWAIILLIIYLFLFHLYQAPSIRLKNHYALSILINAICLGAILYIYPVCAIHGDFTVVTAGFSVLFFLYLVFHEILHQIAHYQIDKIFSLPQKIGIKRSFCWCKLTLIIIIILALMVVVIAPVDGIIFIIAIGFCLLRLFILQRNELTQTFANELRERKDKFFTAHEGIIYLGFLILKKLWIYFQL